MGVGVFADVQRPLQLELAVGEVRPVRAGRDLELVDVVQVVRQHGDELREGDGAPLVEPEHLALVLPLPRAVLAAPEQHDHHVVALQLGQPEHRSGLVGKLEVREGRSRREAVTHRSSSAGRTPAMLSRMR
jgi:hypothetical protein